MSECTNGRDNGRDNGAAPYTDPPFVAASASPTVLTAELTAALQRIRDLEDVLSAVWLYINWRWVTSQLTTPQKTLFADVVDTWSARLHEGDDEPGYIVDRWWRD